MDGNDLVVIEHSKSAPTINVSEIVATGWRWRTRMMVVFVATAIAALFAAFVLREYESETKILVKRERVDLVPAERTGAEVRQELSEEELNTEIELLRSEDVLQNVVHTLHLDEMASEPLWYRLFRLRTGTGAEVRAAKALRQLNAKLEITLPKKSNMITVRFRSGDPRRATEVLVTLSRLYLEKHMAVRRPPEQFKFFAEQVERYREKLAGAEALLAGFPRITGTVQGQMELDLTERRLSDLRLGRHQLEAAIQEMQKRVANLETQLASAAPRMTTAVRTADNQHLMMQLGTTLLNLELKRTELLKKFQPSHREVQEVERQMAQTRAATEAAQKAPLRDETTDRDPTYEWIRSELTKGRADLHSLEGKAAAMDSSILEHEKEARRLNGASLQQQNLLREAKILEESYQLYLRKREEARISDALDQSKMLNVSIAQKPTAPVLPRRSPWVVMFAGIFFAMILSVGSAFISDRLEDSFRSPAEVQQYLDLPVLAVLPAGKLKRLE